MSADSVRIRWLMIGILVVLLIALLPRFLRLDDRPLDNHEAVNALNATQLTPDPSPYWQQGNSSSSPMYEWLTGFVFQLTGSGEAAARVVPAMAGFLLVATPLFYLKYRPRLEFILWALILALSPVAINLSRTASGASLAAFFVTAFSLPFILQTPISSSDHKWSLAAIFLGGALASGGIVYTGLLSVLFAYLLLRWLYPGALSTDAFSQGLRKFLGYLWLTPLVAVVLASGFGLSHFGLSGLGESLVLWLQGWVPFGQLSALGFLVAGFSYEPFILIMGIFGAFLAWTQGNKTGKCVSVWALSAFVIAFIYPGRSARDWVWIIIPLSYLAAEAIRALVERLAVRKVWLQVLALVGISFVLLSAGTVTLIGYVNGYIQQMLAGNSSLIWIALLAMLLLLSSVFVLFGLGWSWDIVWDGAGIVLTLATILLSLSAAWNLATDRGLGFRTLWSTNSPTMNGQYFDRTLQNASLAVTGDVNAAPVFIQGEPDPTLVWRVRAHPRYEAVNTETAATPPILITPEGAGLGSYGAEYFGQDFALNLERGWFGLLPPDLLRWWFTHSAPTAATEWVIYIRADIIALGDFSVDSPLE